MSISGQEGLWPRLGTCIALRRGLMLKVSPRGRACVIVCSRGGLHSHGPCLIEGTGAEFVEGSGCGEGGGKGEDFSSIFCG